jgi:hypothetical protein
MANLMSVCSLAGPAMPIWTGSLITFGLQAGDPVDHRLRLEAELGGHRHLGVRPLA